MTSAKLEWTGLESLDERLVSVDVMLRSDFLREVAIRLRREVIRLAESELQSTLSDYLFALSDVRGAGTGVAEFALETGVGGGPGQDGRLAIMLESGARPFDMRDTMLDGYGDSRVVRMRQTSPSTAANPRRFSTGRRLGRGLRSVMSQRDINRAARAAWNELRSLPPGAELPDGRLRGTPGERLRAHHKRDIFAGMRRDQTTNPATGRPETGTFLYRTISLDNADGWMHPGFAPKDFFGRASDELPTILSDVFDDLVP